jgi:hypothetical protein
MLGTADEDVGDTHSYTLLSNPGGKFSIVNGNELRVASGIDYEQTPSLPITIRVDDGNGGTFDQAFTITVTDLADGFAPPPDTGPVANLTPQKSAALIASNIFFAPLPDDVSQIIRENVTFKIRDMIDGGGQDATREMLGDTGEVEGIALPAPLSVLSERPVEVRPERPYTNLREAIEFLQGMDKAHENMARTIGPDGNGEQSGDLPLPPLSSLDKQFVDVLNYHKDRAAKLREALLQA